MIFLKPQTDILARRIKSSRDCDAEWLAAVVVGGRTIVVDVPQKKIAQFSSEFLSFFIAKRAVTKYLREFL